MTVIAVLLYRPEDIVLAATNELETPTQGFISPGSDSDIVCGFAHA